MSLDCFCVLRTFCLRVLEATAGMPHAAFVAHGPLSLPTLGRASTVGPCRL